MASMEFLKEVFESSIKMMALKNIIIASITFECLLIGASILRFQDYDHCDIVLLMSSGLSLGEN